MANKNLNKAQIANQDEFYTQYADIEREVLSYIEYDADVFRGKTILLPCDDPGWSNFTRFFAIRSKVNNIDQKRSFIVCPFSCPAKQ